MLFLLAINVLFLAYVVKRMSNVEPNK